MGELKMQFAVTGSRFLFGFDAKLFKFVLGADVVM